MTRAQDHAFSMDCDVCIDPSISIVTDIEVLNQWSLEMNGHIEEWLMRYTVNEIPFTLPELHGPGEFLGRSCYDVDGQEVLSNTEDRLRETEIVSRVACMWSSYLGATGERTVDQRFAAHVCWEQDMMNIVQIAASHLESYYTMKKELLPFLLTSNEDDQILIFVQLEKAAAQTIISLARSIYEQYTDVESLDWIPDLTKFSTIATSAKMSWNHARIVVDAMERFMEMHEDKRAFKEGAPPRRPPGTPKSRSENTIQREHTKK